MSVTVPVELHYEFDVKASVDEVFDVLADVPVSASHFPKVDKLIDLGDNVYRWELQRVGTAQVHIQTVYASKYVADRRRRTVRWTRLAGVGNAQIAGSWTLTPRKAWTHIAFEMHGEVTVALPALMQFIVAPVVAAENRGLVETYIHNLTRRFGGKP